MKIKPTGIFLSEEAWRSYPIQECVAIQDIGHRDTKGNLVHDGLEVLQYCMRPDFEADPDYHKDALAALYCKRNGHCIWQQATKIASNISIFLPNTASEKPVQLSLFAEDSPKREEVQP